MHCIVVGCGVSGLSCGLRLLEAGHSVAIWARDLPPHTTSNVAAAVWYPYKAYPEELVVGWSRAGYQAFGQLAQVPGAGVALREGIELFPSPVPDPWWLPAVPAFRRAQPDELPQGYADGFVFEAPVVEMPRYLAFLMDRFAQLGGRIELREVYDLVEPLDHAPLVINCAGLGARELVGDAAMLPIRGQVVRVSQVGLERFVLDDYGPGGVTYIVPRGDDCILGGTAEEGREDLVVEADVAEAIVRRCVALEPRLSEATVLEHKVGLRPGRPSVRLEREDRGDGRAVIHNYGHGGAGVTLSWGCADEVARLAEPLS